MIGPNVVFEYIHNNFVVFHIQLDDLAQPPRNVRTCDNLDSSYRQDSKTKILAITRKLLRQWLRCASLLHRAVTTLKLLLYLMILFFTATPSFYLPVLLR